MLNLAKKSDSELAVRPIKQEALMKIRKILAPTDLSKLSRAGVRYALELARDSGAEVTVYHVVNYDEITRFQRGSDEEATVDFVSRSPQQLLERHHQALKRFLEENCPDLLPLVTTREKVELGKPDKSIVEEADKEAVDLIVISTHGRTGLAHMLLGSVTEKVVREATCPVLSIRPELLKDEKIVAGT